MAQCPTCGSDVSEQAAFCPDCGTDLKPGGGVAPPEPGDVATTPSPTAPPADAPVAAAELGIEAEPTETEAPIPAPVDPSVPPPPPIPAAIPAAATNGAARLTLKRSGAVTGDVFPVSGHVVIGRFDPETGPVDVDLGNLPEATYVSRQHAEVIPDGSGGWRVKDLGSRNGVFVRKQGGGTFQRVSGEEPISGGDEIALGNARFEFQVG
jgi:hypothetical protein